MEQFDIFMSTSKWCQSADSCGCGQVLARCLLLASHNDRDKPASEDEVLGDCRSWATSSVKWMI